MPADSQRGSTPPINVVLLSDIMGSVTRAGRVLGFGWKDAMKVRRPRRHQLPADVEATVVQYSIDHDLWGAVRLSNALRRVGVSVTPAQVREVWTLHGLQARDQRTRAASRSHAAWSAMHDAEKARLARRKAPVKELALLLLLAAATMGAVAWAWQRLY